MSTGSIEGSAASTGLLPLASGVIEAMADFKLEGIPAGVVVGVDTECGSGLIGGAGCVGTGATGGGVEEAAATVSARSWSAAAAAAVEAGEAVPPVAGPPAGGAVPDMG